tara:strand:+ start:198 stop:467 length:270 start_codon:yes stop_codon:yes gene_type:complete
VTGKKTARDILIEFLASRKNQNMITIASHEIEEDVRKFGKHYYNKLHNGSTYSRAWRKLKETGRIPELDVVQIKSISSGSESRWVLQTI